MAISLTTLNGTDSIAASRITLNDNFATVGSALNSLLSMIDIATGLIDNSSYGSNNNIVTGALTSNSGITINSGNITVSNGDMILSGKITFGSGTQVAIKRTSHNLTTGSIYILDAAGATGATSTGQVGYYVLPRQTTTVIKDIQNPELGAVVYDTTLSTLVYCVGTTSVVGGTGSWMKVGPTGALAI
jgi:hypothetical protein